jgi:hypothetical protein
MDPQNPIQPNMAPQPASPEPSQQLPVPELARPTVPAELAPPDPAGSQGAPPLPVIPQVPQITAQPVAPQVGGDKVPPAVVGPVTAEDVDVIEKEWVEKAEQIVEAHKTDPYTEEEAVEDLQIDYLKKRYGKEIHKSGDGAPDQSVVSGGDQGTVAGGG